MFLLSFAVASTSRADIQPVPEPPPLPVAKTSAVAGSSQQTRGAYEQDTRTLQDVLRWTYQNNPTLQAARAQLFAVHEELPQALSGYLPDLDASGTITSTEIIGSNFGGSDGATSKDIDLTFDQPLYQGGRTLSAIKSARALITAERAQLRTVEQDVLLSVVAAYMNVKRDKAVLALSRNNRDLIARQLEAAEERFAVGDVTRTDVSQSRARLAGAEAETVRAAGTLQASRAVYEEVVGMPPEGLAPPDLSPPLPASLDEAVDQALQNNPEIIRAENIHRAAEEDVDGVFGELLPSLSVFGGWNRTYDPQPGIIPETTTRSIGVTASIPLYKSGAVRSRVRQAKHTANQRYIEVLAANRRVRQDVVSNWEDWQAARAEIESREAQVEAARIARDGVHQEAALGARTILDALDADQELLDARTALVTSKRDEVVSRFALAASLGVLSPQALGFESLSEDYERHLAQVRWKILGMDVDTDRVYP